MTPRQRLEPEIMDQSLPPAEAERALADLNRVNRWLFGLRPVRRALLPRLAPPSGPLTLLDVGTGSSQVAADLAAAAGRRGITLRVAGVDRRLSHLTIGRRQGYPSVRVAADADRLPFRAGSFDWSLSTLFFHHFDEEENRTILGEMRRVARRGAAVVDLRRSRLGVLAVRLLLPLIGAGRIARYDGRLSVAQAWTVPEVRAWLGRERPVELRRRFPFRFSLILPAGPPA